jgi:hypothetical protein
MLKNASKAVAKKLQLKEEKLKETEEITAHFKTYNKESAIEVL